LNTILFIMILEKIMLLYLVERADTAKIFKYKKVIMVAIC